MRATLRPGLTHTLRYVVPDQRTAPHLLPESTDFAGLPPVLATGYLVGIVEWACMEALHGHLDETEATLGVHVALSHDTPTLPGSTVTIDATLTEVLGRSLTFSFIARDDNSAIGSGTHRRGVIERARFADRLEHLRGHAIHS